MSTPRVKARRHIGPRKAVDPERNERYTLEDTKHWCLKKAGVKDWTLDVAGGLQSHLAPLWYGTQANGSFIDGLTAPWHGRVWCNPPFDNILAWVNRAWSFQGRCEVIGMLLPANRCEQGWWQEQVEPYRDRADAILKTHFLPGRTRYGTPKNPFALPAKRKSNSPPYGSVFLLWNGYP